MRAASKICDLPITTRAPSLKQPIERKKVNSYDSWKIAPFGRRSDQILSAYTQLANSLPEGMERGGLEEAILPEHFYPSVQAAVDAFLAEEQGS